jgi:tRNA nucleotidyltransferase (CCA-adding enzyme)
MLIPDPVRRIIATLEGAGYEAWCVGGAVRDALLGHADLDWDIATAATPDVVQRLFPRTIPVGIEFGTVAVRSGGRNHEVTTFRRDVRTDGRHAEVAFGASLTDDLARRDFTINAIAYSPTRDALVDPFGGRDDLRAGVVRAVGVAADRMREDRLRALRALRFAARFGFALDPATWDAIVASAPHLGRLSAERVKQELEKTMEQVARPSAAFARWRDSGAFATLVPAFASASDADLAAADHVPLPPATADDGTRSAARLARFAALFAALPGGAVEEALRALKFSNADTAWIVALTRAWHALGPDIAAAPDAEDRVVRRWVAAIGRTRVEAFFALAAARWAAAGVGPSSDAGRALAERANAIAFRDPVELKDLAVDGDDLRRFGITGKPTGAVLQQLLDAVLDDPGRNTPEELERRARAAHAALAG